MRTITQCCSILLLFTLSFTALSAQSQQSVNTIVKDVVYSYSVNDTVTNAIKDSTFFIVRDTSFNQINTKLKIAALRFKEKTTGLKEYLIANDFNPDYCFMIDMSIPSGKKRFFVYNAKKDSVEFSSLVSHGSGSYKLGCNDELTFSNTPNSFATSLGRYKIGASYYGTYGLSYKLYGLDSTNSSAYERAVVLHSDRNVPETETYPRHIYESAGCPIVAPNFLAVIGRYIKDSKKPILMWIYN